MVFAGKEEHIAETCTRRICFFVITSFIILLLYSVVIEEYAIVFEREVEEPTQSFYVRKGRTVETNSTQPVKNRRQIWSVSLTSCSTSTQFCAVVVITTYNRSLLPVRFCICTFAPFRQNHRIPGETIY